jgi:hypothetical protein
VSMQDGALFKAVSEELAKTVVEASGHTGELQTYGVALGRAWQRVGEVTRALYAAGDMNRTLANASLYLEAVGHAVVAWMWLQQALVAADKLGGANDPDFYRGKLQACRYFFNWELPKIEPQLDLLASIDTTTLDMQDAWF